MSTRRRSTRQRSSFPRPGDVTDFRRLFEHQREFDAVVVSTCEHTHAFATMLALRNGKHVYCEKPLTYNIWEARRDARSGRRRPRWPRRWAFRSTPPKTIAGWSSWYRAGAMGPIREVHVWVARAWGLQSAEAAKQNRDIVTVRERPKEAMPVPAGLDWDLWLGPAPARPFNAVYVPGPKWYRWWDFGNGTMSDLGSHWIDLPFWALRLRAPLTVKRPAAPPHRGTGPGIDERVYEYGPRGAMPAVRLTWHQGENKPDIWRKGGIPHWDSGVLFIGAAA